MSIGTPQEFVLPLASGVTVNPTHVAIYSKNEMAQVLINAQLLLSNGSFTDGQVIFTLPEGFRPRRRMVFPVTLIADREFPGANIYIENTGSAIVNIRADVKPSSRINILAVFYA